MEAFHAFRKAAELEPELLPPYIELFAQAQHLLNWKEALPVLETGLRKHPHSVAMNVALAVTLGKLAMSDRAESVFDHALELGAMAGPPYAHWLQEEGRFDDSRRVLLETVDKDPSLGEAYHGLAVAKCFDIPNGALLDAALHALNENANRPESRMFLLYAVAKAYDDQSDFENAMRFYDLANLAAYEIHNAPLEVPTDIAERSVERVRERYPKQVIQAPAPAADSETPVFLIGMIRSGTTLLDQILASHGSIKSAGEQPFWVLNAPRMEYKWRDGSIEMQDLARAAQKYLETLATTVPGAARVVDKMPVNYRHLGLIRMAFPKGRILHLRRNPLDTCLSIYTTYLGNATYFAYHQDNIVRNYREYLALMDYWRSVLPSDYFLEIDYEDLVLDKESTVRRIVAFLGLEWDEACLTHEKGARQVSTPSLFTARQAVHSNSVGRWRRYEPWLGRLMELEPISHKKS